MATCPTDALVFFPDGRNAGEIAAYGENEHLRMIYQVEGRPADYSLPVPVPPNTTTSSQVWKWLIGLVPGGVLLAWLWKSVEQENGHE